MAKAPAPTPPKADLAKTIFLYAEAYSEAAAKLIDQFRSLPSNKDTHVTDGAAAMPTATLDSFACELYLKSLQTIDHGKPIRGHNLRKLFDHLLSGTQKSVRHFYKLELAGDHAGLSNALAKNHPKFAQGLDNCLDRASEVFETVRYMYEGTKGKSLFYWPPLRIAIRKTILAIHPDWAKK